jgi:hypothetical protein
VTIHSWPVNDRVLKSSPVNVITALTVTTTQMGKTHATLDVIERHATKITVVQRVPTFRMEDVL